MKKGIGTIVVVIFLLEKGLNATIIEGPSNIVTEIREHVKLNCTADATIAYWILSKNGEANGELEIVGPGCSVNAPYGDHYTVESLAGGFICNLNIFNITMDQAGVYKCTQGSFSGSSILTVIDSYPIITYNNTPDVVVNETVVITCTLNYSGSVLPAPTLQPHFYWTDYAGNNVSNVNNPAPGNSSVVSQLSVTALRQDIMSYTCHVYLKLAPAATSGYASNTPSVNNSASSQNITVLYPPGNINIVSSVLPKDECVQKQESLTCTADANPPAEYKWLDLNSNTPSNGSVKNITSGGQYQCTAYNDIRNKRYNQTKTATEANCSAVKENNMTMICTKDSCNCTGDQPLTITCEVYSVPKPTYRWWHDDLEYSNDQTIPVTLNGNYSCTARNTIGTNSFEATVSTRVYNCTEPTTPMSTTTKSTTKLSTVDPTATLPNVTTESNFPIGAVVGGIIIALNAIATPSFTGYYNAGTNDGSGHTKTKRNKKRLNKRFPWLQKMLPCLNDTKESAGTNCLWVSLFILLGTFTGIVTFPICIYLAIKSEKNLETSTLNKRENDEENGNAANGKRSVNSPHFPSPPDNQTRAVGLHREDPYQNESRENIELSSSHHSRNLLLTDSPTSNTPPKGKPPPLPNKPAPNTPTTPGRAQNYVVTEPAAMDPNHTTYADLPFMPQVPPTRPVQYLDGTEDAYAELKKT